MFNKFVLIALACVSVSVAQVRKDGLPDAIQSALKAIDLMNQSGELMHSEVVHMESVQNQVIDYRSHLLTVRAERLTDSSTTAIRNVAAVAEENARKNNRPESVFQCIRTNEQKADREIKANSEKFESEVEKLRVTERENVRNAIKSCDKLRNERGAEYRKTGQTIKNCKDTECVHNALSHFAEYLDTYYNALYKIDTTVAESFHNFDNASRSSFNKYSTQISAVVSTGIKAIQKC